MSGTLYGLGLGPGDPELLTLKAHRLVQSVPVIAYLKPEGGDSLARSIVAQYLPGNQAEVGIAMPMRTDPAPGQAAYDKGAEDIAAQLDAGKDVAFLCEGDPFLFGSFMYVFERLTDRYDVEVVAGVSSPSAAAAVAGLPLVERNETLTLVPATLDEDALADRVAVADTVVVMKLGRHLEKVRRVLAEAAMADGAVMVVRASHPDQQVVALADVDTAPPYFSLVIADRRTTKT